MKIKIILSLILTFAFGGLFSVMAQNGQEQKIKINTQKKFPRSDISVRFVSVSEDSRCPENARCVWAGNAKIKIEISNRGRNKQTFEINTNLGVKGASYEGYKIELLDLSPGRKTDAPIKKNSYVATFSIVRLTR